jgi:hypothetical protein
MKAVHVLWMMLAAAVLLAACAAPGPAPTKAIVQGEPVPFEVCGESATWARPSEEEQKTKWWDTGRYAGGADEVIQYPWTHHFFVAYGHASAEYDLTNLCGLWTLAADVRAKCVEPAAQDALLKLESAEVWVLLHRVQGVRRSGSDYYITVEPTGQGVQFVQFDRPEQQVPLTLHFVTESGQELEEINEAQSPYWPYPQLVPTRQS